ncbi:uncharacterized protein C5L36_0C11010 [Pichia kudriavzevii]|uniref:Phosphatidic acid phosphatase type 2/haloperoxidase domain-containing protein n=1 Tax=Pichia kudriavzevii TaxID=4909 RepID=A0A2U9R7V5_PICKU|nr:uncharacterized protein C5L36_0C11010 [Pichia kudriavzevii]AWU77196.1 hypothetical protein C5L36_0C11010 [Pichia kudriavzevii]
MVAVQNPLIPFDHTYILYSPDNIFSLPLAAASLTPILILVFLFSWFVITREIEPCIFAAGHVCNDILSGILKNTVRYPRPIRGQIFKQDGGLVWGMPSSHTQFMSFWFTYTLLAYILNYPGPSISKKCQLIYSIGAMFTVGMVIASRIVFEYHNWNQVIVGLLLGSVLACFYWVFVNLLREYGIIDRLLSGKIFKLLLVKDSFGRGSFPLLEDERRVYEEIVSVKGDSAARRN